MPTVDRIDPETGEIIGRRVYHPEGGRILTKQSDALASDINSIVKRHIAHKTPLPHDGRAPAYGDFSQGLDYHQALNRVVAIDRDFADLPAAVRAACNNDPGQFLEMVHDPENRELLTELGLAKERIPETAVPAVAPPAPATPPGNATPAGGTPPVA